MKTKAIMSVKEFSQIVLVSVLLLSTMIETHFVTSVGAVEPLPIVAVDPVLSTADIGETFSVNITITGVGSPSTINGLFWWQFIIIFDANILHAVNVTEGSFLGSTGENTAFSVPQIDNDQGFVIAGAIFLPSPSWPEEGVIGNGTLATVTFEVVSSGVTQLHFDNDITKLGTVLFGQTIEISHTKVDGTVICMHAVSTVDINPNVLNSKDKGKWITAYIQLPEGSNVGDIDVSTIMLNDAVPAESSKVCGRKLMVKFDRAEVMALLSVGEATLTITGEVNGTPFEGSDTIRVR